MGLNWAEHTVEISAPIATCFEAITDYETFPKWQSAVVDTEVLDWDERGRGKRVRLFIDAKVRKVDYTLDYRYDEPTRIEWDFVEGNGINGADGHYLFDDLGDGRTRATYKLGLEVGIPLPGPVARRAHKSTLKASVEDLKREAERRATSAAAAQPEQVPAGDRPPETPVEIEVETESAEREARFAEQIGIKAPERPTTPEPAVEPADDWGSDGSHTVAELPGMLVGEAASIGRRVTRRGVRTAQDVGGGAAEAGLGAARRAVDAGLEAAGAVRSRAGRLLGRDRADQHPR
ncbi:MAG TPA: SRPBCC family protein [Solirubrobacterales bacterium]|nr:SRPBCC family protein [Solirubrobacterales bacterium]